MIKKLLFVFMSMFISCGFAAELDDIQNKTDFLTTEEILSLAHTEKKTNCASKLFLEELVNHINEIKEDDPEYKVKSWVRVTMTGDPDILTKILDCPELQKVPDETTIYFTPIEFTFPGGKRTLTIKYSTQPKVLKQKLILSRKPSLPTNNANPKLMDPDDPAKYINTDPAWYAIMVVQHDSLKEFVGEGKNNTLSMKYLNDHISDIYPHGYYCTSRSAWANDNDTINKVVREVVNIEDDSNDYYVAGDINLEWVMYAEIAAEIIITVATLGVGEGFMASAKGLRAIKNASQLVKNSKVLRKLPHVAKYSEKLIDIEHATRKVEMLDKNISNAKKYSKLLKKMEKANKAEDIAKYKKEADEILKSAQKIDPSITDDLLRNPEKISKEMKDMKGKIPEMEKELKNSRKNYSKEQLKDIDNYVDNVEQLGELLKYRRDLRGLRMRPQTGNIITRNLKKVGAFGRGLKAANNGSKLLRKSGKLARAGMSSRSAKMKHWLIDTTLKHGSRLARFERDLAGLYAIVNFLGDMYDKTSTTSQEFTNGIEFKPFCLLSADDLKGQENVVNYGMWLMWTGNSTDEADDDAAYLQAMDFASKFFYELDEFQDKNGANCNVDIYVVRPIIRLDETNMNDPKGELFYLFMNEIPWSTAEQFGEQVQNIEDWERTQQTLETQDPHRKYGKKEENSDDTQEHIATQEITSISSTSSDNIPETIPDIMSYENEPTDFKGAEKVGNDTIYIKESGEKIVRSGGTVAWRNNNPGNIIKSKFAMQNGAIGSSGRWAVFPDEQTGLKAIIKLLKTDGYKNLNISQAIHKWCPWGQGDNPDAYTKHVSNMTGLNANSIINDLSDTDLFRIAKAIQKVEGWKVGTEQNISEK